MSFKRKFTTPTKMAPGDDDDDDVTRRSYDSRPSSARTGDSSVNYWSPTSTASAADANLFPSAYAGTGPLLDFRTRGDATPRPDRERKTDAEPEVDGGDDVMGNIRSVVGSASTFDEKQRVLTMMISQLQSLKQNLFQQKSNGVCTAAI